jgi:antitoxin MazE
MLPLDGKDSVVIMYTHQCIYIEVRTVNLQIAKWGNSLALRIPAEYIRQVGIKEGDSVEARLTVDGGLTIRPTSWDRKAFMRELTEARKAMPVGTSVIDELRRGGRY